MNLYMQQNPSQLPRQATSCRLIKASIGSWLALPEDLDIPFPWNHKPRNFGKIFSIAQAKEDVQCFMETRIYPFGIMPQWQQFTSMHEHAVMLYFSHSIDWFTEDLKLSTLIYRALRMVVKQIAQGRMMFHRQQALPEFVDLDEDLLYLDPYLVSTEFNRGMNQHPTKRRGCTSRDHFLLRDFAMDTLMLRREKLES